MHATPPAGERAGQVDHVPGELDGDVVRADEARGPDLHGAEHEPDRGQRQQGEATDRGENEPACHALKSRACSARTGMGQAAARGGGNYTHPPADITRRTARSSSSSTRSAASPAAIDPHRSAMPSTRAGSPDAATRRPLDRHPDLAHRVAERGAHRERAAGQRAVAGQPRLAAADDHVLAAENVPAVALAGRVDGVGDERQPPVRDQPHRARGAGAPRR